MPAITVKGVTLSPAATQTPHIIVPIMADSAAAAAQQAAALAALPAAQLVELRLDPLLAAGVAELANRSPITASACLLSASSTMRPTAICRASLSISV